MKQRAAALDHRLAAMELERRRCERSLLYFVRCAWPIIEPAAPYVHGRHVDAICMHLEATTRLEIRNLIVNMPPRHMKSSLMAVLWPAWVWTFQPESRWLFASYAAELSTRDSMKRRRVMLSPWYQALWGDKVQLVSDLNLKTWFQNEATGYMLATSVGGRGTGEGGDYIIADDANKAGEAHSKAKREEVIRWWDLEMSTRGNDPKTVRKAVVQQRLHVEDLTGHLDEQGGYEHLCLRAEHEPEDVEPTCIGWQDWRTEPGELLWPERFDRPWLEKQKRILGSYGYAGQFQQRPSAMEGGMIKRAWLKDWSPHPDEDARGFAQRLGLRVIQSWDCTQKKAASSDFTCGQVWGIGWPNIYLLDQIRDRMDIPDMLRAVERLSAKWPESTAKFVEEQAGGHAVMQLLRDKVPGLIPIHPKDSKESRLQAVSHLFEGGNVFLPPSALAPWVGDWVEELCVFPSGSHDDQVDATSQALMKAAEMGVAPVIRRKRRLVQDGRGAAAPTPPPIPQPGPDKPQPQHPAQLLLPQVDVDAAQGVARADGTPTVVVSTRDEVEPAAPRRRRRGLVLE